MGPRQLPGLHALLLDVLDTLDVPREIPLYVTQTPFFNAGAYGLDEPFVVLHSAVLDLLGTDERRALLGHEVGHVLSGHSLYRTLLALLLQVGRSQLPLLGGVAALPLRMALLEWSRKSELSADRAALLATQDLEAVVRLHVACAGGSIADRDALSTEAFLEQARDYERMGGVDGAFKVLNLLDLSHPFHTLRAAESARWFHSREYHRILEGHYRTRDELPTGRGLVDDLREGAEHYARRAQDAAASAADEARRTAANAARAVRRRVRADDEE